MKHIKSQYYQQESQHLHQNIYWILASNNNRAAIAPGLLPTQLGVGCHVFVSICRIKKGNAQGSFDKFCYGFVTINGNESSSKEVMDKVSTQHPGWRLKIKEQTHDNKFRQTNSFPQSGQYQPMGGYQGMGAGFQSQYQNQGGYGQQQGQNNQHYGSNQRQGNRQGNREGNRGYETHGNNNNQQQQRYQQPQPQNDKGQIFGEKKNRIMVRELWLGGIPEMIDHSQMAKIMSVFGIVQATEIFPKFAFVKFKKAQDAATAYERAQVIYESFGQNSGFRIAFSDPSRRKQIVSNHYEFERNAATLPVLFLGFPPVTSANVEIHNLLSICQKYGNITNYYLKKSTNSQMRSYVLFTYDNLKNAIKAKQQLCRRKDLLGEKRVEITLLLEEDSVIKNRDFSHTEQYFVNDANSQPSQRPRRQNPDFYQPQGYPLPPSFQGPPGSFQPPFPMPPGGFPGPQGSFQGPGQMGHQGQVPQMMGQGPHYGQYAPPRYPGQYPPPYGYQYPPPPPVQGQTVDGNGGYPPYYSQLPPPPQQQGQPSSVLGLLQQVLEQEPRRKAPRKEQGGEGQGEGEGDVKGIIDKMLGKSSVSDSRKDPNSSKNNSIDSANEVQLIENEKQNQKQTPSKNNTVQNKPQQNQQYDHNKDTEPTWSGFLTWRGTRRVGVDGYAIGDGEIDFVDYSINITSLIHNDDVVVKDKINCMVLQPTNSIHKPGFKQYVKVLRKMTGFYATKNWVIYLIGKNQLSSQITQIQDNQILAVMENISLYPKLKDKLIACDDSYFEE